MTNLIELTKEDIKSVNAITKNGNAIVTLRGYEGVKCIIRRGNFNSIMCTERPIMGAIVPVDNYDLPVFKTLKF